MKEKTPPDMIVEVEMKKTMRYDEAKKAVTQAESKNWKCRILQVGFGQNNLKKEIKN